MTRSLLAGLFALILLWPGQGWAATAHVQANGCFATIGSSLSCPFVSNVAYGNTVVGSVVWDSTSVTLNSVTVCGNAATLYNNPTTGTNRRSAQYVYSYVIAGSCSVVHTFSGSLTDIRSIQHEVSGVNYTTPVDQTASNVQTNPSGTDSLTSGAVTTTENGEYIFGATHPDVSTTAPTAGTGFTIAVTSTTRSSEYQIQSSAGSIAATFTPNSTVEWATAIITLRPGDPPPPLCAGASPSWVASPSQASVAECAALSSPGDTISVSNGSATWTQRVTMPSHALTLRAQTPPVLDGNGLPTTHYVTITDGTTYPSATSGLLTWTTASTAGLYRISGIKWVGNAGGTISNAPTTVMRFSGNTHSFRFDHNEVTTKNTPWFNFTGDIWGVIDHNKLHNGVNKYIGYVFHDTYNNNANGCGGGAVANGCGDAAWAAGTDLGTEKFLFTEDNLYDIDGTDNGGFAPSNAWDGWSGARTVHRFNTVYDLVFANHGTDSTTRSRGGRAHEYYSNTCIFESSTVSSVFGYRSGTGVTFNNTCTVSGTGFIQKIMAVAYFRNGNCQSSQCGGPWWRYDPMSVTLTSSGTTATAETSVAHQMTASTDVEITMSGSAEPNYNGQFLVTSVPTTTTFTYTCASTCGSSSSGTAASAWDGAYPGMDQPGRGGGDLVPSGPTPAPAAPLNQVLDPLYMWGNTKSGTVCPAWSGTSCTLGAGASPLTTNIDIYSQDTGTFDATTGVGTGLRASRPATCTTGVAYWATDGGGNWNATGADGGLDKCTATNTWTNDSYVPYSHPHPLTLLETQGSPRFSPTINLRRAEREHDPLFLVHDRRP